MDENDYAWFPSNASNITQWKESEREREKLCEWVIKRTDCVYDLVYKEKGELSVIVNKRKRVRERESESNCEWKCVENLVLCETLNHMWYSFYK